MLENIWFVAAIWMGLAFIASLISIRLGVSVALIEILIGVIAGNFLGIHKTTELTVYRSPKGNLVHPENWCLVLTLDLD